VEREGHDCISRNTSGQQCSPYSTNSLTDQSKIAQKEGTTVCMFQMATQVRHLRGTSFPRGTADKVNFWHLLTVHGANPLGRDSIAAILYVSGMSQDSATGSPMPVSRRLRGSPQELLLCTCCRCLSSALAAGATSLHLPRVLLLCACRRSYIAALAASASPLHLQSQHSRSDKEVD
jgi:hypothetical protein